MYVHSDMDVVYTNLVAATHKFPRSQTFLWSPYGASRRSQSELLHTTETRGNLKVIIYIFKNTNSHTMYQ